MRRTFFTQIANLSASLSMKDVEVLLASVFEKENGIFLDFEGIEV